MIPKTKQILTLLLIATAGTAAAEHITSSDAYRIASEFAGSRGITLKAVPRHAPGKNNDKTSPFYVFNSQGDRGFVIVSGDDRTEAILGYTDSGSYDPENIPDNVRYWLDYYAYELSRLDEVAAKGPDRASADAQAPRRANYAAVGPLLSCQWNQDEPFWNDCPVLDNRRCYTGCVTTATTQVMYYHKWPQAATTNIPAYTFSYNNTNYQLSELSSTTFDWNNMLDKYSNNNYNGTQAAAVAQLMRYVGQAAKSGYGPDGTGAGFTEVVNSLRNYFGYDMNCHQEYRVNFASDAAWEERIYSELTTNGPVAYAGATTTGAHAFVCDGYDGNGKFHINWGWGGYCDGYYVLSVLKPEGSGIGGSTSADGYNRGMEIIAGVKKPGSYLKAEIPVITFYRDGNYGGVGVGLGEGEYKLSDMKAYGLLNDDISSARITPGFKAIVYADDNFGGSSTELASDAIQLGNGWNDNISSIKIVPNGKTGINGFYKIRNKNSGKYLDTDNNKTDNNTAIIQYDNEKNDPSQTWAFTEVESGVYKICALNNQGRGFDVLDGKRDTRTQVQLYDYVGGRNQQFILFDKGSGYYQFVDRNSGNVVEMPNSTTGNGEWIKTWSNNGTDAQLWALDENQSDGALTATMYVDDQYRGKAVSVCEGEYNTLRMNLFNIKDKDMTSLKVTPGFKVTVYDGDNFSGESHVYTSDNSNVGGFNDKMSSFKVETNGTKGKAGNFKLKNRNSGKYLDTADNKTDNNTAVMQNNDEGDDASQTWTLTEVQAGVYKICAFNNKNRGLNVLKGSRDDDTQVNLYDYSGEWCQQFILYDKGSGWYQLIDRNSGKAVEIPRSSTTLGEWIKIHGNNGTETQQWAIEANKCPGAPIATVYTDADYKGTSVQLSEGDWNLSRLERYNLAGNVLSSLKVFKGFKITLFKGDNCDGESKAYTADAHTFGDAFNDKTHSIRIEPAGVESISGNLKIRNRNSGQYLDTADNSTANDAAVVQYNDEGDDASQTWNFTHLGKGVYKIVAFNNKSRSLNVLNASRDNKTQVNLHDYSGLASQQFIVVDGTDGYYQLIDRNSGKAVEIPESSKNLGEWIKIYDNNGSKTQQWGIEENRMEGVAIGTLYKDIDYKEASIGISEGDWSASRLERYNYDLKAVTSLKVTPGFKIIAYKGTDFNGDSKTFTSDAGFVGADFNDQIGSLRIVPNGATGKGGDWKFRNRNSGQFLDIENNDPVNGAKVIQWTNEGNDPSQVWRLSEEEEGVYTIAASAAHSRVIDIPEAATGDGVGAQLYASNGGKHQQFILLQSGDNYKLVTRHSGKALEIPRSSTDTGVQAATWSHNDTDTQQWNLVNPESTVSADLIGADGSGIRVNGGRIEAPEGSEIYDAQGRRVARGVELTPGIYIVRIGSQAVKVLVK